ncbi:MAG: NAD(+) synthase, partial [Clostridia bacterium]|nr:NAD(+) synthase [Clostridia bacterium]
MFDFLRAAAIVPNIIVGDTKYNTNQIKNKISDAIEKNADIIVFPELSLTGYTCADLFGQATLVNNCKSSIRELLDFTKNIDSVIIVGAPISILNQLYNCAVVLFKGKIAGIVPKTFLPDYNEFCEKRWFSSAQSLKVEEISSRELDLEEDYQIPVGKNLIFDIPKLAKFGIEICEDLFAPIPTGNFLALNGAELIVNLAAINDKVTKRDFVKTLVKCQSSTRTCAYVLASSGSSESTTDLVFSGYSIIAENGKILAENKNTDTNDTLLINDIDIGKIKADRQKNTTFSDCSSMYSQFEKPRYIKSEIEEFGSDATLYSMSQHPFIPDDNNVCLERCMDIFRMQVLALSKRIKLTGLKMVVGVSGGLDSTLALLVAAKTAIDLKKPLSDVIGITMPCFGTSNRTYSNSLELMKTLGICNKEINIKEACIKHFEDIEHDINIHDLTYENTQARERTQVLMDYAGKVGGLVVGTGDLSELALGWCTYNGDHMSMYSVNCGIPKTLIPYIIASIIKSNIFPESSAVLKDIVDTPISPELLPPDENGNISQETEDIVGPYELHDFFLYYILRFGFEPAKVYYLAQLAFDGVYDSETIKKWLNNFYKRFFTQQFKRSCLPDGVKIGSVGISPRGDLKMPSDASAKIWLDE